ncbi:hypothetical protein [Listeria sp. PSOL-1]|uniref:hypothetical protein n=1 Tax=Listeria sp. PSOL-1 TaxID=1844999 RepID=UPI0013D6954B|nr:hypothetical protein [Listeria sp. PSOL-1]
MNKQTKWVLTLVGVFVALALVIGGVLFIKNQGNQEANTTQKIHVKSNAAKTSKVMSSEEAAKLDKEGK